MPPRPAARAYIAAVIALGGLLIAESAAAWNCDPFYFALYILLALFASTLKVRLPGLRATFSASAPFTLLAISQLGFSEAIILSVACAFVQTCWRASRPPLPIQVMFNGGVLAISSAATSYVYRFLLAWTAPNPRAVALIAASCVFFIVNTFAISAVVALVESLPLFRVWRQWHLSSFPYYLVSVGIAALIASSSSEVVWKVAVAAVPLIGAVFFCYQLIIQRFGGSEQRN